MNDDTQHPAPDRSPEGWPRYSSEPSEEAVAQILKQHWLTGIHCDEATKTDTATCYCTKWKSEPQVSVGAAVDEWIGHVLLLLPAPAAPASGAEQELIAELEKTNNEIIASDGDTCEYTAMVRDVLAIAKRAPSLAPPGWEEAREACAKAAAQHGATWSTQNDWKGGYIAGSLDAAVRIRSLPTPSPSSATDAAQPEARYREALEQIADTKASWAEDLRLIARAALREAPPSKKENPT